MMQTNTPEPNMSLRVNLALAQNLARNLPSNRW